MKPSIGAIAVLTVISTSCALGTQYRAPQTTMPQTFHESSALPVSDSAALETWWTQFSDPALNDLIARAIAGNIDLKIAEARILEARAARGIAASGALPHVDAGAAYARTGRSNEVPPFNSDGAPSTLFGARTQNVFLAGFDARWEIDVFGGVKRDVEAAVAQVQAFEEARRDVLVTLLGEVSRNYVDLRGAQRQMQILDATVQSLGESRDLAQARFVAGLGTALDTERIEGLVQTTMARRPELERLVKRAVYRIGVLIGREPAFLASTLETARDLPVRPPGVPATLPSELLLRRPDVRRSERQIAAATARVGVARADLFPRFSISGSFGRRSDDAGHIALVSSQFFSIGPSVTVPILSGGRIRANIRVHEARQEIALQEYQKAVLTALEDVENALAAHNREEERLAALRLSVDANRRALVLATNRYTGGLESFLSVLDAQRALYVAEAGVAESETAATVSMIAIYKALGGGWTPGEL